MSVSTFFNALLASTLALAALLPIPALAQDHGLLIRPDVGSYYDNTFPPVPPTIQANWSTVEAFPNLSFLNPLGLTAIPGTNKLVVWEREGKIWVFDNSPATLTKTLLVDLSTQCQGWDDSGLLGVALHPDFATNRQVFVWYSWRGGITGGAGDLGPVIGNATTRPPTATPTRNRLSRFVLDANFQTTLADEYVVIDQKDSSVWHNGGGMFFHPENGFLYITNGDDSNGGLNTQRIDRSLFSCVIRIDVDQRGGSISHAPTLRPLNEVSPTWPRYFVPNDNPFVGQTNALEEIYAIGLRSPHRMTIDAVTGRIFIGDVGGGNREEISVIEPNDPAGLNFQWDEIEGFGGDLALPFIGSNKRPIIDYPHGTDDGSCIIGGYVYRGTEFPELVGKYLFGDNMSGRIWYLDETTSPAQKVLLATLPDGPGPNSGNDYRGLSSFGLDASRELYICRLSSTDGRIYKLQRGGPPLGTPLPPTLSSTGFFSDLATLTASDKLLPYDINAPFWSDGAVKKRFAAIPNGTSIGFAPQGEWAFPAGSVFVKHFDLPASDVNPNILRRLETRFIVKQEDGSVYGATYKWRADQSDADLLDGSLTESIPIETASLGTFTGQDIGNPALSGSTVRAGNLITVTAGGTDIWNGSDQFHFAHQLRSGDFDVSVRVESVTQANLYTKTGLMVRESLAADAKHVMALVFPSNAQRNNNDGGYEFQYRATTGGGATALYPPQPQPRVSYPDTWLRMKREGNTFIAFSGSDGFSWREYARTTLAMPAEIRFGLAVTAHTASPRTTAKFQIETRRQPWYYPGRQDCVTCHNSQSGGVLGLSTRQLNRDLLYSATGITDNQVRAWNHVGLLENGPPEGSIPALDKLAHHTDPTASLEKRARSYLDANCSSCHRPGGVQAHWDARYQTPFPNQGIYYGQLANNLGNPNARVVVPQSIPNSILHQRVNTTGLNQMPPIARNLVDHAGVEMLADWIQSLPPETVDPPDTLVAVAQSHTQVDLTWEDRSDNEAGFYLERSTDNLTFSPLTILDPDTTAFSDTGAEPFTTLYYRISSFANYVYSARSNVAFATTNIGSPAPEIRLLGSGQIIANNDISPEISNGTDFGVAVPPGQVTRSFTIENIGNLPLLLEGSPRIRIDGTGASSFSVVEQPSVEIPGPSSLSFQIHFIPQTIGIQSATVTIPSNDPNESDFTFAIVGKGVAQDMIAWWKFDETAGTFADDATGNNQVGTLTAPYATWTPAGRLRGALRFTGELNQSVTIANHASLNPTTAISITSWVFASDWNGNRRILQKGNNDSQYRLLVENGDLVWDIATIGRLEAALPTIGEWFHLAATYDGVAMKLFVNGVQIATQPETGTIPQTSNSLYLGTKTPGSTAGDHFNGYLDDVRLFGRGLSENEIATLVAQTGEVSITASDAMAQKGVANPGAFLVTRTGPSEEALPIGFVLTADTGQGIQGQDYSLNPTLAGFSIPAGQNSATLVLNPKDRSLPTGILNVTLSVGDAAGYIVGSSPTAQIQILDSPFNEWKVAAFGNLLAAQGPAAEDSADADADGLSTLLEAALGGDPQANSTERLPTSQLEIINAELYLTSTYVRPRPPLAGLDYLHRTSLSLSSPDWQTAVLVDGYPLNNLDGTETIKFRSLLPISSEPHQFLRLQIERP